MKLTISNRLHGYGCEIAAGGPDGQVVARVDSLWNGLADRQALARQIVRAVNCHDELLAACQKIKAALAAYGSQIDDLFDHDERFIEAQEAVDAAVAKATA